MSSTEKIIFASPPTWEDFDDTDSLALFMEKVSLESSIPVTTKPLDTLADDSSKTKPNIINNENREDVNNLLIEDKFLSKSDEKSEEIFNLPKEEVTFISDEEKESSISVKKETCVEVSNIIKGELSSDSSSDTDDSDSLLTRGKEKTKRKSCRRKQYERSTDEVNVKDLNQHSLQFLSSGCIVQNNTVNNLQAAQFVNLNSFFQLHPIKNVDSANFTDSSIYSPLNVSSPESGYDTQSSEVCSPSPPNIVPIFSNYVIKEETESQSITDIILDIQESIKNIETQNLEVYIPGIDDLKSYDYIEKMKLYLKESDNESNSNTLYSEHSFNLEDSESLRNEITGFIPLQNLLDDYETESNSQSTSTDSSLSELEYIYSESNVHRTTFSPRHSSVKPIKRKIYYKLNDIAKNQLRYSEDFNNEKYLREIKKVLNETRVKKRCIDIEQQTEHSKRTNSEDYVFQKKMRFQK